MIRPNFLEREDEMSRAYFFRDDPDEAKPKQPRFSEKLRERTIEKYRARGEERLREMFTPKSKPTAASALYPHLPNSAATDERPKSQLNVAQTIYPNLKTQASHRAAEAKPSNSAKPTSSKAAHALYPRLP
jgi:hypothetical protein